MLGFCSALTYVSFAPFMVENTSEKERVHLFSIQGAVSTLCYTAGTFLGGYLPSVLDMSPVASLRAVLQVAVALSALSVIPLFSLTEEKREVYEEIPHLPWNQAEWSLYHGFKDNVRIDVMPVLRKCGLRFERYQTWFSELPRYADIRAAFYPHGFDSYFIFDFLLRSDYHSQLVEILGMLPSTSIFFSVGEYLFARVHMLTKREKDDLFALMHTLGERGFFTNLEYAHVDSSSARGPAGEVIA